MGQKKKRAHPEVDEVLARPWCYYCERDFEDLKILISHQKAKHFKCERCGRRLNTAGGLSVHMNQVHKEQLLQVENALPNRQGLEVEIFGMEGIPEDIRQAHAQRIIAQFYQNEADRRAATGNQGGAVNQGGPAKKPKFESPAELKKRLAEHKARKAESLANGGETGGNTPLMEGMSNSPMPSPANFTGSAYPTPQVSFNPGQPPSAYGSFSQEVYPSPAASYPQSFSAQPSFSAPPGGQFPLQGSPPPQLAAQQNMRPGYQGAPPNFQTPQYGGMPGAFGGYPAATPPGSLPNRPPGLPAAPGLPQRPSFGAPPTTSGLAPPIGQVAPGWNGQVQNPAMSTAYPPHTPAFNAGFTTNVTANMPGNDLGDDIDKLIRMAEAGIKPPKTDQANVGGLPADKSSATQSADKVTEAPTTTEKKSKKDKPTKMIYSDNEYSPEEKMAKMARYAFIPDLAAEATAMTMPISV